MPGSRGSGPLRHIRSTNQSEAMTSSCSSALDLCTRVRASPRSYAGRPRESSCAVSCARLRPCRVRMGYRQRHRVEHRDASGSLRHPPVPTLRVDGHTPDRLDLCLCLDAFDDAGDVELKGHGGNAMHDGGVGALVGQSGGEGRVHLEDVNGQYREVPQGGVGGPEVIDRDPDTSLAQPFELGQGGRSGSEDGRLGDLKDQPGWVEVVSLKGLFDADSQVPAGELAGADVDREAHVRGPGAGCLQGQVEDPVTDGLGQPRNLGGHDRGQCGHEPALGVGQAHQGFGADDDVAVDVDDGLEDQRDPVVAQSVVDRLHEHLPCLGALKQVGVEDVVLVPAAFLRAVHGGIGATQELVGAHVRFVDKVDPGDADARGQGEGVCVGRDLATDDGGDPAGNGAQVFQAVVLFEQDDELVAADACDGVGRSQRGFEVVRDVDEDLVSRVVTGSVVDGLEPVKVDEQCCDARVVAAPGPGAVEGLFTALEQQPAIGETGELVVQGIFVESLLGSAPGGDVLDLGEQDALSIKLTYPRQRDQGAQRPAVGVAQGHLGAQLTLAGLDQLEDAGLVRVVVKDDVERLTDELLRLAANSVDRVALTRRMAPSLFTRNLPMIDSSKTRRKR